MPEITGWDLERVAVLFAIGVLIVGALLPFGGGEATRITLVDSTAIRTGGAIAVDLRLQLQSAFAASEIRVLLIAMNESWRIPRIVFYLDPAYLRSAVRDWYQPANRFRVYGLRLARTYN